MTHTRSVALAVALPAPLSLVLPISALPSYLESLPRSVHVYRLLAAAVCMVADPCMLAAVRMFAAVECTFLFSEVKPDSLSTSDLPSRGFLHLTYLHSN